MKYSIAFVCIALLGQAFANCEPNRHSQQIITGCCGNLAAKQACKVGGGGCDQTGTTKACLPGCVQFQATSCSASPAVPQPAVAQKDSPILKEEISFPVHSTCGATSLRTLEQWLNSHPFMKQDRQMHAGL